MDLYIVMKEGFFFEFGIIRIVILYVYFFYIIIRLVSNV